MGKDSAARFTLLLLVLGILASSCNGSVDDTIAKEAKPKPTVSSLDFGQQREGAIITFPLVVDNTTAVPLKISTVTASCGCTVPDAEYPTTITPGEMVSIPIKWTLPAGSGSKTSNILVAFESQTERGRQYALKAEIPETYPVEFDLGIIGPPPVRNEYDFLLKPFPGEEGFSISKTESSSDSIVISGVSAQETGFRLAFHYATDMPGKVRESISIVTNDPVQPLRTVQVKGRVIDFVEIEENVVYLGCAGRNEPRKAGVKLLSPAKEQKDQLVILDSNFQLLATRGLDIKLENGEVLTLVVETTSNIVENRSKGTAQREVAKFNWSLGQHRGEAQLEIVLIVM